ncbi:MAG: hypothetical protein LBR10_05835 [Prevotellaceae bacterium]|jgi:hypothetical protein|nr:hypothetical protein [Prevotellaceae bacterium]
MSKFKQPATVVTSFYEGIKSMETIPDENTLEFDIDSFSSMSMEAVYILDFQKRCFHYVSSHELFLCGYPQQEVMRLGYDFYPETVHPDDFLQFKKIHNVILKLLCAGDEDEPVEDINYFSFTLRLKNRLQRGNKPKYLMVYHKLKPIFINGQIRFGLCMLTCSVMPTAGNLRIYYKNNRTFSEYSFNCQQWKEQQTELLTEQETLVLMLAKQQINHRGIMEQLSITYGALRNIKTTLLQKLNVKTIEQGF